MPLQKLAFPPGINKETTQYGSEGVGWFHSDKIRFRKGMPEKIGGWAKRFATAVVGSPRDLHTWRLLSGETAIAIGTETKIYVLHEETMIDITPLRPVTDELGDDPFEVTYSSNVVTVTHASHGLTSTDAIIVYYSDALGGIAASELNGERVATVVDANSYTFVADSSADSTRTYGGGNVMTADAADLVDDALSMQASVTLVTCLHASHGLVATDTVTIAGAVGFVGVPATDFNAVQTVVTVLSPNAYTFNVATTSDALAGGGTNIEVSKPLTTGPLASTDTSAIITVTHAGHGATAGDYVELTGATAFANFVAGDLNKEFTVAEVVDADNYTVTTLVTATSTASGGGDAIIAAYQIAAGDADDSFLLGWGAGTWGDSTWGTPRTGTTSFVAFGRLWSMDNWGEDLVINPWGGSVYKWDATTPTARAKLVYEAPSKAQMIKVTDSRHLACYGCNSAGSPTSDLDTMNIAWCSQEDITDWDITDITNTAGDFLLTGGSQILSRAKVEGGVLIWTEDDVHIMQSIGAPYIFNYTQVGTSTGIVGPNAWATHSGATFWMGNSSFYAYRGGVTQLECSVQEYVFDGLSFDNRRKVFAGIDRQNNEVTWFYPSATLDDIALNEQASYNDGTVYVTTTAGYPPSSSGLYTLQIGAATIAYTSKDDTTFYGCTWDGTDPASVLASGTTISSADDQQSGEPFRYVTFSLTDGTWWIGLLERVSWMDRGEVEYPLAGRADGYLFNHEYGVNAESAALVSRIESSEFDLGEGDSFMFVRRVIPDFDIESGSVDMVFKTRRYPHSSQVNETVGTVTSGTEKVSTRIRGRQMSVVLKSKAIGDDWRYGATRLEMQEDGLKD